MKIFREKLSKFKPNLIAIELMFTLVFTLNLN